MKKLTNVEVVLKVSIEYQLDEWETENRYYVFEEGDKQDKFIYEVCKELENDFSKYVNCAIEAVWCADEFNQTVSEIVFGKYEDETFEESMYNEYMGYIHRPIRF